VVGVVIAVTSVRAITSFEYSSLKTFGAGIDDDA
jgi:hypothetical protein